MELRALERVQERVEWEREMRDREEALLSTFISVVVDMTSYKFDPR